MDTGVKGKILLDQIRAIESQISLLSEEKKKLVSELNNLPRYNLQSSLHTIESPITEQICKIRSMQASDSAASKPPIPLDASHPFRSQPVIEGREK